MDPPNHLQPTRAAVKRIGKVAGRLGIAVCVAVLSACALQAAAAAAGVPTIPPEAQLLHPAPTITHGPDDAPRIALTFDDNYDIPRAYETLDVLTDMRVPATVFVIGHYQNLGPRLSHRLAQDGFEIGDHTRSHANTPTLSWRALQIEIGDGTRTFRELTGSPPAPLFRPPGGFTNDVVATAATAQDFRYVVLWDIDTEDWKGASAAAITKTVLSQAHNGAIVLMHLAAPHTAEALPGIVSGLRDRGYELVTVTELLRGDRRYVDVDPGTSEGTTILEMIDAGYLPTLDADYFGPFDSITRAQLARAAVLATGPAVDSDLVEKPDAATNDGEAAFVGVAAAAGLMGAPTEAHPADEPLNRVQLAQVAARMARTKGYTPDGAEAAEGAAVGATAAGVTAAGATAGNGLATRFADVPTYAADDVRLVVGLGLMSAEDHEHFGVYAAARRRHVATVLKRFLALPTVGESTLIPVGSTTGQSKAHTSSVIGGLIGAILPTGHARSLVVVLLACLAVAMTLVGLRVRALRRRARHRRRPRPSADHRHRSLGPQRRRGPTV